MSPDLGLSEESSARVVHINVSEAIKTGELRGPYIIDTRCARCAGVPRVIPEKVGQLPFIGLGLPASFVFSCAQQSSQVKRAYSLVERMRGEM